MTLTIIITLGPSILSNKRFLNKIGNDPNIIFRINGAHGTVETIGNTIDFVRNQVKNAKIMVDLPGNKIRTSGTFKPIFIRNGKTFRLYPEQINFKDFYKYLFPGDIILANDGIFRFEVKNIENKVITMLSHSDGYLEKNKGLHVKGITRSLPHLFEKDKKLIELAVDKNIDFLGLSFVRNRKDIIEVKKMLKSRNADITLISKIEVLEAYRNIKDILNEVEYILIDRGDLSSETGITKLPYYQEKIIEIAKAQNKKIFLATQFLRNMVKNPIPLIAEAVDLYRSIKSGIFGLQLSEETAIGKYPEECIQFVRDTEKLVMHSELESDI